MGEEEGSKTAEGGQTAEEQWPGGSMKDGGGWPVAGVGWGETVWSWGGGGRLPSAEGGSSGGETKWRRRPKPEACSRSHGNGA